MSRRLTFNCFFISLLTVAVLSVLPSFGADEVYGPPNMLKTLPTPFGSVEQEIEGGSELAPMSISSNKSLSRSLSNRLLPPRLYLPGRMVIGQTAEFIIKGAPGTWVALAMADKNVGAKPIYGHSLRLGADRKLVSLGCIPAGGVLSLFIDTPIQGDLIGSCWYFEAALWTKPDFSDLEIATPVQSELTVQKSTEGNGVTVAAEPDRKRGMRFVPDVAVPLQQQHSNSLDSGRP